MLKNSKARLQKFYTFDLYSAQYWNIDIDIVKKNKKRFALIRKMKFYDNGFYNKRDKKFNICES